MSHNSLILEIQAEAIRSKIDVASLLRKAKVAAVKLDQSDAVGWIDLELDGYGCKFDELPDYRRAHGVLKLNSPYRGLIPVNFNSAKTEEMFTRTPINDGVGSIQSLLSTSEDGGDLQYLMSSTHKNAILNSLQIKMEPVLLVSQGQMKSVLERVVSLVLNWSLALEKAGVLGVGMSFSNKEREMAKPVTHTIIAQNIGHLGDISGHATGRVEVNSAGAMQLDQRKIEGLVTQAREALEMLPKEVRGDFAAKLEQLENASSEDEKRSSLRSARSVLEGAGGNLAAHGIISLISSILG